MKTAALPFLGVIEGFYGRPWSHDQRIEYASFLKHAGFSFYIYAPKADEYLRKSWHENHPKEEFGRLKELSKIYQNLGVQFGIGLSPFEIYLNYGDEAAERLQKKIRLLNELNPDILCLLFDDMKGDASGLAEIQARILNDILPISTAKRTIICPTYYSFDPVLDQLFGSRPDRYLEELGRLIPEDVDIFWTGDEICSTSYSKESLDRVTALLKRKPFLWDNYPVNDTPKIARFLNIGAFTNRPSQLADWTAGHAVNPMSWAELSKISLTTLPSSYREADHYQPKSAFLKAAKKICGENLATLLEADLPRLQISGRHSLTADGRKELKDKYQAISHPCAHEVAEWIEEAH